MENIVIATFGEKAQTYEALSQVKSNVMTLHAVSGAVLENENGVIVPKDGYSFEDKGGNWLTGGLIGALVGILGGPLGVLFGGSLGALLGGYTDMDDAIDEASLWTEVMNNLYTVPGQAVLILVA